MSTLDPDRFLRTDHLAADIRRRSVRGGVLTMGAQGIKVIVQLGAIIVLARLLSPAAFGLIAMIAAIGIVLDLIKEFGLSAATIQRPEITHAQVTALFWVNAATGFVIALALIAAAPAISRFYGQPDLIGVTRWLALGFFLNGVTIQHWALLRRQMRFGAIAVLDTGAEIAGLALGVAAALAGAGYWALVAQRLTGPALGLIGSWSFCRWRPGRPRLVSGVGELLSFGASVTGCNIASAVAKSIDQILIGWLWGAAPLGLYERASKLIILPINNINAPLYAVAMPTLSRLSDQKERYRRAFGEIVEKLAMITMPAGALMAVTADWVVAILFGRQWAAAAPLVAWFGLAAAYQPFLLAIQLVYLTQNRARDMLRAVIVDSILGIVLILLGLNFGVIGVAAAYALGGLVFRAPVAFWFAGRRGAIGVADLLGAMAPSACAALVAAGSVSALRFLFLVPPLSPLKGMVLSALAAIAASLAVFVLIPRSRLALRALAQAPALLRGGRAAHSDSAQAPTSAPSSS